MIVVEVDPVRALSAAMEGYRVLTAAEAARVGDVFITVTGDLHVLRGEHFDVMQDGAVLANAGHFDVEIDLAALEARSTGKRRIRHEPRRVEHARRAAALRRRRGPPGEPGAAEGHPAEVMDMSFADQALAAEWLVGQCRRSSSPGCYRLPEHLDAEVATIALDGARWPASNASPRSSGLPVILGTGNVGAADAAPVAGCRFPVASRHAFVGILLVTGNW